MGRSFNLKRNKTKPSRSAITVARFWNKVNILGIRNCWPWRGGMSGDGYGRFRFRGKTQKSNRVAFRIAYGHLPRYACHHCDNRLCCNPYHIYDGTAKTNADDCTRRGRRAAGEDYPQSKLSKAVAIKIYQLYYLEMYTQRVLAKKFNVSSSTISSIIRGKRWRTATNGIHLKPQ